MPNCRCQTLSTIDSSRCLLHANHVGNCAFNDELLALPIEEIAEEELSEKEPAE